MDLREAVTFTLPIFKEPASFAEWAINSKMRRKTALQLKHALPLFTVIPGASLREPGNPGNAGADWPII